MTTQGWPIPELIVFPEASIPLSLLHVAKEFAAEHDVTVFAGTHSYQRTRETSAVYQDLGIKPKMLKEWGEVPWACTGVLPVFSNKSVHFHRKRVPSVFEITDVTPRERASYTLTPLYLTLAGQRCRVLPVVCAEALQRYTASAPYDLAVVCAYNAGTEPYDSFVDHHVFNRIPVVLCNDGRYGGSGIHVPTDRRMNLWWWSEPFHGRLPRGDGIVIVELDWDSLATQVGVADPKSSVNLSSVAAISYEEAEDKTYSASEELAAVALLNDNTAQHERIKQMLDGDLTLIQRQKSVMLHRLTREGSADASWWGSLGQDALVAGQPSLAGLEAILGRDVADALLGLIQSGKPQPTETLGNAVKLMNECKKLAAPAAKIPAQARGQEDATINREAEASQIAAFLNHPRQVACLVYGLDAIGKTTAIGKAVAQSGHRHVVRLALATDVTPEILAINILTLLDYPRASKVADPIKALGSVLPARLRRIRILIIEETENLFVYFTWRDDRFKDLLTILIKLAAAAQTKVIFESRFSCDLPIDDPNVFRRVPIRGLANEHGLILLSQQLRRTGVEPAHYAEQDRTRTVEALGGHAGAIILVAEYIERVGIGEVIRDFAGRKGVYNRIAERVLRKLSLSENEIRVLSILAEARAPIPASVIAEVTPFDPMPVIQDLWRLALIDRYHNDFISIAGLLRGFADITAPGPKDLEAFHIAAATAFRDLAAKAEATDQLRWTVEARYHALSAGHTELAPDLEGVADGALGALSALVSRNNYERALPILEQLLSSHRTAEILELGAIVYARTGDCDEALVLAKEAVSIQPERVWILTEVGRLSLNVHRDEIAEDALRIARANGTDNTFIATLEGKIWDRRKRPDEAIAAFRRGVTLSEYDGWPHFYLGRILVAQGEFADAINVLEDGERIESSRYRPRRNVLAAIRTQLALAFLHSDDVANGERWLSIIVADDPGNPEIARAFAYLRVKKGEVDVASKALEELDPSRAKNRHERAQIHLFRGQFFLSVGERAKASEEFNLANLADPQNVFVLLTWAENLYEMAREATAEGEAGAEAARVCADRVRDVCEKVLEYDSDNPRAMDILERLYDQFGIS